MGEHEQEGNATIGSSLVVAGVSKGTEPGTRGKLYGFGSLSFCLPALGIARAGTQLPTYLHFSPTKSSPQIGARALSCVPSRRQAVAAALSALITSNDRPRARWPAVTRDLVKWST